MMDVQQAIALAVVAAAAALLVARYAGGRRRPKHKRCADCAGASPPRTGGKPPDR